MSHHEEDEGVKSLITKFIAAIYKHDHMDFAPILELVLLERARSFILEYKLEQVLERLSYLESRLNPSLHSIKLQFKENQMPTPGPITLTTAGQQATASVVGFDQFGNPFTGPIPTPTFSSDDTASAIVTFDPSTGLVTAIANGVANITASLTSAEGLALTDTEAVTVALASAPPAPTPVLSSIKVAFA